MIGRELFMCPRHWSLIPEGVRYTLRRRNRIDQQRGGRPSILWLAAARAAIDAVADHERNTRQDQEGDADEHTL